MNGPSLVSYLSWPQSDALAEDSDSAAAGDYLLLQNAGESRSLLFMLNPFAPQFAAAGESSPTKQSWCVNQAWQIWLLPPPYNDNVALT